MFIYGDEYTRLVRELISKQNSVDIAVAFLGAEAGKLLSKSTGGRVICNLESGATNPAVVKTLRDSSPFEIKSLPNLHAKVILSNGKVLCGSANISANGLGLENVEIAHWHEAGIFSQDVAIVEAAGVWFRELWQRAHSIEDEDILTAETRWKARRSTRPSAPHPNDAGLFSYILINPEFVLDRPIYLAVYRGSASDEAKKAFRDWEEKEGAREGCTFDFYEDWSGLPNNAYLVDIPCGPRGGVSSGGLFWTGPEEITEKFNYRGGGKGELRIVFKLKMYEGLQVRSEELKRFVKKIAPTVRRRCLEEESNHQECAFCIPLASIMDDISGF